MRFSSNLVEHKVPVAISINIDWICEMVEENLVKFFSSNGGWVCSIKFYFTSVLVAVCS